MRGMSRTALLGISIAFFPAGAWAQTCNTVDRSVLLILDASGSMNAKLPNGETRIAVARGAVKGVASFIPGARATVPPPLWLPVAAREQGLRRHQALRSLRAGERQRRPDHRERSMEPPHKGTRRSPIRSIRRPAISRPTPRNASSCSSATARKPARATRRSRRKRSPPKASPFTPWDSSSIRPLAGSCRRSRAPPAAPISMRRWDRNCPTH